MRLHHSMLGGVALAAVLVTMAREAKAVPCNALAGDTAPQNDSIPVLYIENGDTQEPLLKRIGKQLIQTAGAKVRIVYRNRPTCELADNFYNARDLTAITAPTARPLRYIPESPTFDPAVDAAPTCEPQAPAPTVQLAIGATFLSSCATLGGKPSDTSVITGPNQAYGFVVHPASAQIAITAEEGYLAFGYAADGGGAAPWLDQALRLTRGATASTALTTSANIGLTAARMVAGSSSPTGLGTSALILTGVSTAADVQSAIGTLGGDLYDANRDKVKLLAFKAFNQRYAYYPDATSSAFDKRNVRDGHYLIWSPTPYIFAHTAGTDTPSDATVARVVDLLFGETTEADVNGLAAVAQSGLIPQCAMKVQRSFDGGDLSLYAAPEPCGCFYETSVPSGSTACTVCTNDTPCGGGACRHGYCEAK